MLAELPPVPTTIVVLPALPRPLLSTEQSTAATSATATGATNEQTR
jgi:hypothetical protein